MLAIYIIHSETHKHSLLLDEILKFCADDTNGEWIWVFSMVGMNFTQILNSVLKSEC